MVLPEMTAVKVCMAGLLVFSNDLLYTYEIVAGCPDQLTASRQTSAGTFRREGKKMTTESILLVDDNPTNLQMLFQLLEKSVGCKLLVAKNGETALTIARKTKPDLILLDIMMPGIDGFEVCRRLKAEPATSPIRLFSCRRWTRPPTR